MKNSVLSELMVRFFLCLLFLFTSLSAQTIGIFTTKSSSKPWDPDSIQTGITGSEEAVIYLSQHLAQLGYRVYVLAHIPEHSRHSAPSANPRFVSDWQQLPPVLDIGISWRVPRAAGQIRQRARKVYFWPHDSCIHRLTKEEVEGFDDVLWLSQSQRKQWMSWNAEWGAFTHVFGNGINPEQFQEIEERSNPYSCIYASSYDRGLDVLLSIWPVVKSHFPKATLDIYYGWQSLDWLPEVQSKMQAKAAELRMLDVREHGLVGHRELTRAFERASFWTYPCTALDVETFCITGIRAQCAGAIPVIINGSAFMETVQDGYKCTSASEYLATLLRALGDAEKISVEQRQESRDFVLKNYTWGKIASRWKELFTE